MLASEQQGSFAGPAQPAYPMLRWLGMRRFRVLRWRDRLIPWQARHFYYRHEQQARIGTHLSLGVITGHLFYLLVHLIADTRGISFLFPPNYLQSAAMLIPGLSLIARRITLQRGKRLYHTGEIADELMLLVDGYGRLCMEQEQGRCMTVGLVSPGDVFGEEALLDVPERESSFEAVLPSRIDIIPRAAFTAYINNNPALLLAVTTHFAQRLLTQQRHMARLAFEPLDQRLAWILLELSQAIRSTTTSDSDDMSIPIYHNDLAAMLGVWRETITATLNRWANDGLIEQQPGHILLKDIARLRTLADDASD